MKPDTDKIERKKLDKIERKKLESVLLAAGFLWGGSAGVGLGVWLVYVKHQPPLADGPLAAAQAASPYVVLVLALMYAIDKMLLATANAARSDEELLQAEAYSMLRAVSPSASAALTAGYLAVSIAHKHPVLVIAGVIGLLLLGAAIAWVSWRIAGGETTSFRNVVSYRPQPWSKGHVFVLSVPLVVTVLVAAAFCRA